MKLETNPSLLGGRYRLLDPIGRGGMGTVYTAIQEGLGRRVAVKLLDPRLTADRDQLERFRREAEVVAALGHPNIVQVTDFQYPDETNPQPFLVMELLKGESLGACIARQSVLPFGRVAFIAAQVLSALAAAHRAGVVHRDIKPDNVFLLADAAVPDTVKVLDFGIAKMSVEGQAKLTGTGAMLGTPAFMAPEQARGAVDVDARADIYAVGAMMYQALTGKLPYEAPSVPALLFAIVEKSPASLREARPDAPAELVAVVERAMAKDRDARFADAEEMRRALAPWSGLPASIPPPVSATAATLVGASTPRPEATPIVVHRTPAPNAPAIVKADAPPKRSLAGMIMITLVAIVGVLVLGAVVIVSILVRARGPEARREEPAAVAASSNVVGTITQPTIATAASSVAPATPTASATASSAPASPIVVRHSYSAPGGFLGGSNFGDCAKCDWETFRADMGAKAAEVSACFKASVYEPPKHQDVNYKVGVTATGEYTTFEVQGNEIIPPRLDRCLVGVMKSTPLHKSGGAAGSFNVGFRSECPKWAPPDTLKWCPD